MLCQQFSTTWLLHGWSFQSHYHAIIMNWATLYFITIVLSANVCLSSASARNTSCPTWFYYNKTNCECECGVSTYILCNQKEQMAMITDGICVTSSGKEGQYYAGSCPFRYMQNNTNRMFSELPSDPDQLNETMCGPYSRRGLLCGQCIDEYGPAVNSLDMKCANCSKLSTLSAVCLYLLIELLTSTLLFICAIIFRINITVGPLLGYMLFCQMHYFGFTQQNISAYTYIQSHTSQSLQTLCDLSLTLSGLWSLQYFRVVMPSFCISSKLTQVHIHMLRMAISLYPILLVILTCFLIALHGMNCRIIHIIWKPFSIILKKMKITTVTTDAVIHVFAAYIFLSATSNTYDLIPLTKETKVISSIDGSTYRNTLYFDSTVVYFSHTHILYLLIALVPTIFLVFIPAILLCVYPTRIYRYISRIISARKRLAITAFAEALHNCFKDGLNDTRDYRALAGVVVVTVPLWGLVSYVVWKIFSVTSDYSKDITSSYICFIASLLLSHARPCKSTVANVSLSYHVMAFGILCLSKWFWILVCLLKQKIWN